MKSVIIVRHAKSSWDNAAQPDFDRPLNDRGKRDAPEMAARLKEKGVLVDAFISSPAKRARKTAAIFAAAYHASKESILLVPALYEATPADFEQAIANAPAEATTICLFSHNPGITEFANLLTSSIQIDNMPTCGVLAVQADINTWDQFATAMKKYLFFDYPKAH